MIAWLKSWFAPKKPKQPLSPQELDRLLSAFLRVQNNSAIATDFSRDFKRTYEEQRIN